MLLKDFIASLLKEDPESEVVTLDPDTGWSLPVKYIGKEYLKIKEHAQDDSISADDIASDCVYIVSNYFSQGR